MFIAREDFWNDADTATRLLKERTTISGLIETCDTIFTEIEDAQVMLEEEGIRIDTLWQATDAPQQTTLFVHVVDAAGNLVAQADGDPLGGSYPLDLWPDGSRVLDTRRVDLEETSGLGVRVGLYDRLSESRLEARGASGESYADNAVPLGTVAP